jgi:hypothetical protein
MPYKFIVPSTRKPSPADGTYQATVSAVTTKNQDGQPLVSRNGDVQLRLTLDLGQFECSVLLTLPSLGDDGTPVHPSGETLLRILTDVVRALGNDIETGAPFEISSATFLLKHAEVEIENVTGSNGKTYAQVKRWRPVRAAAAASAADPNVVPF